MVKLNRLRSLMLLYITFECVAVALNDCFVLHLMQLLHLAWRFKYGMLGCSGGS